MKKLILLLVVNILILSSVKSQKTYVPDDNFEQALINLGYDSGVLDDSVLTVSINTITSLSISYLSISNLIGIEDFTALNKLSCNNNNLNSIDISSNTALTELNSSNNNLTSLDVSKNTALSILFVSDNNLDSLDVSKNKVLFNLNCRNNNLDSLDISNNTSLRSLNCNNNNLSSLDILNDTLLLFLHCNNNNLISLDVSKNKNLEELNCNNNNLTNLDLSNGNNSFLLRFDFTNNSLLTCIQVDDTVYSNNNWTGTSTYLYDSQSKFSLNCGMLANIREENNIESLKVFPNPTTDILNIEFDNEGNYSLFSIDGKQVIQSGMLQSENTSMDISSLRTGMYLLRVVTDEGNVITKRVVKQ